MSSNNNLAYFLTLSYNINCIQREDSDGTRYWIASYPDIMGCSSDGATRIDAVNNVKELFKEMVEEILKSGNDVPVPKKAIPEAVKEIIIEPTQSIPVYFSSIPPIIPFLDKPIKKKSDIAESSETKGIFRRSSREINMADGVPA